MKNLLPTISPDLQSQFVPNLILYILVMQSAIKTHSFRITKYARETGCLIHPGQ